ncbi:MAG: glycerophosphodiester phosphodiesterase [Spirochaetales bacterium]|nr:glycerophosphodiester phosphodiesterase [Spirochaetales bacterium]
MQIFGHRGIPSLATENSLNSFEKILEYKVEGVEFDVHLTKDEELVVIHDFNTLKMSGEDYEISETNYETINSLIIGDNEKIPLLSQVFDLLSDKVFYDIEVKSRGKNRSQLCKKLLELIKKYNLEKNCMISSFDPLIIKEFNKLNSGILTAVIYCNDKDVPFILRHGLGALITKVDIIKPHYSQLKGFMFFILTKVFRKKCFVWTVNRQEDLDIAKKRGCFGVCSDNPQTLKQEGYKN